jgi:hypothetical protein
MAVLGQFSIELVKIVIYASWHRKLEISKFFKNKYFWIKNPIISLIKFESCDNFLGLFQAELNVIKSIWLMINTIKIIKEPSHPKIYPIYDLFYFPTHPLKWKTFEFETYTYLHYLVLNFYQINEDGEIRTCDRLVIKTPISCQRTISPESLSC